MPREVIHRSNEGSTEVGWSKEAGNSVQLGVGVPGIIVGGQEFKDVWVNLNRQETNRLIQALRKARDATFGADE